LLRSIFRTSWHGLVSYQDIGDQSASEVIDHLAEGWSVRSTARSTKVCNETVARLWRVSGRHVEGVPDRHVHDLTLRALAFDEQWAYVKKSQSVVLSMSAMRPVTSGTIA
jgi:hypothetical protein